MKDLRITDFAYNLTAVFCLTCVCSASSQKRTADAKSSRGIHGTVNIVLADRHGLVALTDSRLGYVRGHGDAGNGQKVFQIDDRTVCLIAGYVQPPTLAPKVDITISSLIKRYARTLKDSHRQLSFEEKLASVGTLMQFYLGVIAETHVRLQSLSKLEDYRSSVILIGYDEKNKLKFGKVEIFPGIGGQFHSTVGPVTEVDDAFVHESSGVTDVVEKFFAQPSSFSTDPDVERYGRSISDGNGSDLTLIEMEDLASQLKKVTAKYSPVVGGEDQTAIFTGGQITIHDPYHDQELPAKVAYSINIYDGNVGSASDLGVKDNDPAGSVVIVMHNIFQGGSRILDGEYFIGNSFKNALLIFNGGDMYFDPSNTLTDTTLEVGDNVRPGDPTLCGLKKLNWERIEYMKRNTEIAARRIHACP